jgi:hypothetical protein
MPTSITEFVTTPNPNALKCVVSGSLGPGPRSFSSPSAAATDPLANALLALPGITSVLIHDSWFTVSKSPDADWKTLKTALSRAVEHA